MIYITPRLERAIERRVRLLMRQNAVIEAAEVAQHLQPRHPDVTERRRTADHARYIPGAPYDAAVVAARGEGVSRRPDCTIIRRGLSGSCAGCGERVEEQVHCPDTPRPALYHGNCCPACRELPSDKEVDRAIAETERVESV